MKITTKSVDPKFMPFSVTIEFETSDEVISLMAALNRGDADVKKEKFKWKEFVSPFKLFTTLSDALQAQNIRAY